MKITMKHVPDSLRFTSTTEDGRTIELDGAPAENATDPAQSPMQALLSAVAACSSIDVVEILKKMRQPLEDLEVRADGDRREEVPRKFTGIKLHFILKGKLKPSKVEQALELSVHKYCSVAESLKPGVPVSYTYKIISPE